jgi:hypothetical protein
MANALAWTAGERDAISADVVSGSGPSETGVAHREKVTSEDPAPDYEEIDL